MRYAITGFKGKVPALHDRALPENFAVEAINARFRSSILEPIGGMTPVANIAGPAATIHLFNGTWLSWSNIVDAVPAPIAENRLYYTGDGAPKVRDAGTIYGLALPAPTGAPTVANLSAPDPALIETCLFSYTFVTSMGEESKPSPASAGLDTATGTVVRINGFSAAPAGRAIVARRIYRSITSAAGVTGFYFVTEIPLATTSFDHNIATLPLGEALPSAGYDTPPDGLLGLTAMPNGMMAAFVGKDVYFCEPYRPHAWPEAYVMTVDYPVVGLCAFGSYLAVLTSGTPYVMQGTHPESMASEKLDAAVPCLSRRGIVDIGMAAYFPSTEGLMQISASGMMNVTASLFTRDQWLGFSPDTISAERQGGSYVFLRTVSAFPDYYGGSATGWGSTPSDLIGGNAGMMGYAGDFSELSGGSAASAYGQQQLGLIETAEKQPFLVDLDGASPLAMHNDTASGNLYMLGADGLTVSLWDDRNAAQPAATWRSKRLTTPFPESFSVLLVKADRKLVLGDTFAARVYANDRLVSTVTKANEPVRIAAALAEEWVVEVESSVGIVAVTLAQSVDEAMGAAA